jgi:hypothetical protein
MAWSDAAPAQTLGGYSGTTADGNTITFTVAKDSNNKVAVTGMGIGYTAKCRGTAPATYNSGIGFGADAVIKSEKAKYTAGAGGEEYYYIPITFDFASSPVSGTISVRVAILDMSKGAPTKTEFCESATQAFTATLTAPSAPAAGLPDLAPGTALETPSKQ